VLRLPKMTSETPGIIGNMVKGPNIVTDGLIGVLDICKDGNFDFFGNGEDAGGLRGFGGCWWCGCHLGYHGPIVSWLFPVIN
jgi:hypothetical protein